MIALVLFLVIFLSVLVIGHGFLYYSFIRFFAITQTISKKRLAIVLACCAVSFVPIMFLARAYENSVTGALYAISGLWLAIGWHVLMACCVAWLVIGIARWYGREVPRARIATLLIIGAFLWSFYGIWCAFFPRVVHVTVQIDDLPAQWHNKTLVQLSDVHMGHVYGVGFLTRIIRTVNAQQPDVVVITGDFFDGMDRALDHMVTPLNTIMAPDGVYVITGNHETYIGVARVYDALRSAHVTILDDAVVHIDGMQIIGISYPERGHTKNIAQTLDTITDRDAEKPQILLYHSPDAARTAKNAGIDLQLSGHTHRGQLFPFHVITRAIYGPYHHGLTKEDAFTIYTSNGIGTWGPSMRTSGRPEIVVVHFES